LSGDRLEPAGAGEGLLHVLHPGAHPLAGDVVPAGSLQVAQVVIGGEAPVDDADHPVKFSAVQVFLDFLDHRHVGGVARSHTQDSSSP